MRHGAESARQRGHGERRIGRHTAAPNSASTLAVTDRLRAPWPYTWRWTTMHSSRTVRLFAAIVATLIFGGPPFGSSRAETVSTGVTTTYPKANDAVDGTM